MEASQLGQGSRCCGFVLETGRSQRGSEAVLYNYDAGSMGLLKNLDMRFWNLLGGCRSSLGRPLFCGRNCGPRHPLREECMPRP